MARRRSLVEAVRAAGHDAFVADTAPLIFRLERAAEAGLGRACDPLFDRVDDGELGCIVSTLAAAELLVGAHRRGGSAIAVVDAFLRGPSIGVSPPDLGTAGIAAQLLARGVLPRLVDAFIAATAVDLGLPLVTADRRLARSGAAEAFLVADFA